MELDGQKVVDVQTTVLEKIAKGICWKDRLELEQAEGEYKSLMTNLDVVKTEMMGLQTIYKNQETI